MAVFKIDTDAVSTTNEGLNSIKSAIDEAATTIGGFSVDAQEFNFASARNAISEKAKQIAERVNKTVTSINNVVEGHTALQGSLKYEIPGSGNSSVNGATPNASDTNSSSDSGRGGSSSSSGGSSHSGGSSSSSNPIGTTDTGLVKLSVALTAVSYAVANLAKLPKASQSLFGRPDFSYNSETGYAMIGNRFVIACDKSYGKVGDVISFIQKDGSVVECVIGAITDDPNLKNKVRFFVNSEKWSYEKELTITKDLTVNTTDIYNRGNVDKVPADYAGPTVSTSSKDTVSAASNDTTNADNTNAVTSESSVSSKVETTASNPSELVETTTNNTGNTTNTDTNNAGTSANTDANSTPASTDTTTQNSSEDNVVQIVTTPSETTNETTTTQSENASGYTAVVNTPVEISNESANTVDTNTIYESEDV